MTIQWPRATEILRDLGFLTGNPEALLKGLYDVLLNDALTEDQRLTILDAIDRLKGTAPPPFYKPKHLRRGRLVDAACNLLGAGRTIDPAWWEGVSGEGDDDRVEHEECRPFIDAYAKFLKETRFTMNYCALKVQNTTLRYVGHIDQIGAFRGSDVLALLDLKTGGKSNWHRLQLGLYAPAVMEKLHLLRLRRFNLYLTGDGKYELVERKYRGDVEEAKMLAGAWWIRQQQKED